VEFETDGARKRYRIEAVEAYQRQDTPEPSIPAL
jgi:hypothetical protein